MKKYIPIIVCIISVIQLVIFMENRYSKQEEVRMQIQQLNKILIEQRIEIDELKFKSK